MSSIKYNCKKPPILKKIEKLDITCIGNVCVVRDWHDNDIKELCASTQRGVIIITEVKHAIRKRVCEIGMRSYTQHINDRVRISQVHAPEAFAFCIRNCGFSTEEIGRICFGSKNCDRESFMRKYYKKNFIKEIFSQLLKIKY